MTFSTSVEPASRTQAFEALADSPTTALLAPSRQAAHNLHQHYDRWRAQAGDTSWSTPTILSVQDWIRQQLDAQSRNQLADGHPWPTLVDPWAEVTLWSEIVADRADQPLVSPNRAAALAAEAYELIHTEGLPMPEPRTAEWRAFLDWSQRVRDRCSAAGRGLYIDLALEWIRGGAPGHETAVYFSGWYAGTRLERDLISALQRRQCDVFTILADAAPVHKVELHEAPDPGSELRAAIDWAYQHASDNPKSQVAIAFPDLGQGRDRVMRALEQRLAPQAIGTRETAPRMPFNLSGGSRLASIPVVRCAHLLLRLLHTGLATDEATELLCSPYWVGTPAGRSAVDLKLRESGHLRVRVADIVRASLPQSAWVIALNEAAAYRDIQWLNAWVSALRALGWPGDRPLDSGEVQAASAWGDCLRSIGELASLTGSDSPQRALSRLAEVLATRVHQPKSDIQPITVITLEEADSRSFDAIWIAGMDDESWPPAPRLNPFVPIEGLRAIGHRMSGGAAAATWGTSLFERLVSSNPHVNVSWSASKEGRGCQAAPCLPSAQILSIAPARTASHWGQQLHGSRLERAQDPSLSPIAASDPLQGGTARIGDAATCPFHATARWRLQSSTPEAVGIGPDGRDRGTMVHQVMERIWRTLQDQKRLLEKSEDELAALVATSVDMVVSAQTARAPQRMLPGFAEIERVRLNALAASWLEFERRRPPFEVALVEGRALASEHGFPELDAELLGNAQVGPLTVRMRMDRVDRMVETGELVVLDYKSGKNIDPPWNRARPAEAQALVYATSDESIVGIGYARLNAAHLGLNGIGSGVNIGKGITTFDKVRGIEATSWGQLKAQWASRLNTIGTEIAQGHSEARPAYSTSCRKCPTAPLCRIGEADHRDPTTEDRS